jgi:putative ABC transport system permease protein
MGMSPFRRLWNTLRRSRLDDELRQEVETHLALIEEEELANGLSSKEAGQRARSRFGSPLAHRRQALDAVLATWLEEAWQDVRFAVRQLQTAPGLAVVAVISLTLGIGANTAVFSLADELLLRPLAVPDSDRVVTVSADHRNEGMTGGRMAYANYVDLSKQTQSFDGLIASRWSNISFGRSRDAAREVGFALLVSGNFFRVLRVEPVLGRGFAPTEGEAPGRDAVAVLGYDFWRSEFGGDISVLGATVWINGVDFRIVGVAPSEFKGLDPPTRPSLYIPLMMAERIGATAYASLDDRFVLAFRVRGRLRDGISQSAAQAELSTIWRTLERQYPDANKDRALQIRSHLAERIQRDFLDAAFVGLLSALALIVLLIACANVANLMLGRARSRSREIAVRLALGVSRFRLIRQLMTESLVLAVIASVPAVGAAYVGIRFLRTIPVAEPAVISPQLDLRVLGFSLLVAVGSAVLFGLAPVWQSLRTNLILALRNLESAKRRWTQNVARNALVVAQIALSMVLLIATGMLVGGFQKLLVLDPGFRTDGLLMMSTDTSLLRYTPDQSRAFYQELGDSVRARPGVFSAALSSSIPLGAAGQTTRGVIPEGYELPAGQGNVSPFAAVVDEHYFATMKVRITRGRAFTSNDRDTTRLVAVVNEEFAKRYWPNQEAVGKRLQLDDSTRGSPWVEVVGVAATGRYLFISEPPTPYLYLPFSQSPPTHMWLLAEPTSGDAAALTDPLVDVIRSLDADLPISNVRTLASFYQERAMRVPIMVMQMVGTMGLMGLALALIGLYAVVAHAVGRRTREIGIRMAIGATRQNVVGMVLRHGLGLSLAGAAIGVAFSIAGARLLETAMIGLGTSSAAPYVATVAMLVTLTIAASYVPASRAARINPVDSLRCE